MDNKNIGQHQEKVKVLYVIFMFYHIKLLYILTRIDSHTSYRHAINTVNPFIAELRFDTTLVTQSITSLLKLVLCYKCHNM